MKRDAGSASLELVLLTPVVLLLLLFVVCLGRLAEARGDVDRAARDAARAASIARDASTAEADGLAAAAATLHSGGVTCRHLDVVISSPDFTAGGSVRATVDCIVDLADLSELRVPGSRTLTASFSEPIDVFRGTGS